MPRILLVLSLLCLVSLVVLGQGTSIGTAVALPLSGTTNASMSDASATHYWKITTTANMYVRVEVTSSSSIDVDLTLYDTNGSTTLLFDGRYGTYSEVFDFLKPGTYYVKAYRFQGTTGTYTVTTTSLTPSRAADAETNDSPSSALTFSPTATSTGHLGFHGTSAADNEDYWKITTSQDGWLRIQVRSDSLDLRADGTDAIFDLDATLYDAGGTPSILFDGRNGTFSQVDAFLRPGTYYVKVNRYRGRGASYEIRSDFFPPPLANDAEGNDSYQTATTATVNGSVTGHIGYYSGGSTDSQDYWKFTTSSDGKILVQVTSDSLDQSGVALDLDLTLYDVNGGTSMVSDVRYGKYSEGVAYVRPGTFYVRVNRWQGNGGSYTLKVTHTPPSRANDVEGNDTYSTATLLTFGLSSTGHLGYYVNTATDRDDYWKVVAPSSDSIYVHVSSDTTIDLDVTAFGPDGVTSLDFDGRSGTYSRVGIKPTAGSTYYFKLNRWGGTGGSYSIVAVRSSVPTSVEVISHQQLLPTDLTLAQNYPNPFNPTTTIRYGLPKEGRVRIAVYSILGQEVAVLQDGVQSAAYYNVVWNGKSSHGIEVPSGIYLIRLQAGDQQIVKKAVLIR